MKAGHKPGSVLAGPLGWKDESSDPRVANGVTICLGPPLPTASSGALGSGRGRWPTVVPGPCSQPGFTEPAPLDAAGALLPHPCTLACAPGEANLTGAIGGVFLWHCPHGRPHWALPSRPGHWGARTFLNRANVCPKAVRSSIAITSPAFTPSLKEGIGHEKAPIRGQWEHGAKRRSAGLADAAAQLAGHAQGCENTGNGQGAGGGGGQNIAANYSIVVRQIEELVGCFRTCCSPE